LGIVVKGIFLYEISSAAGLTSEKMGVTIVRYEMLYAGDGESL